MRTPLHFWIVIGNFGVTLVCFPEAVPILNLFVFLVIKDNHFFSEKFPWMIPDELGLGVFNLGTYLGYVSPFFGPRDLKIARFFRGQDT